MMVVDHVMTARQRHWTYNKGVIGELVSVKKVLEEIGALIAGVSPRHG